MIECFKCKNFFPNPDELCNHLKKDHNLCGRNDFKCTLCGNYFGELYIFRKHLKTCIIRHPPMENNQDNVEPTGEELEEILRNQQMLEFLSALKIAALALNLEILGDMNFARSVGFKMLGLFQKFLSKLSEGLKIFIGPVVRTEYEHILEDFITFMEESFEEINTECTFHSTLLKNDLICSLEKYIVLTEMEEIEEKAEVETVEEEKEDEEKEDEEKEDEEMVIFAKEQARFSISPFHFEIKKFFELPNVFEKVKENTVDIQRQLSLNHFITGEVWKQKLRSFDKNDTVIPYHFYMDGVQLNNALGTHTKVGVENCSYYMFPTVPNEYQSRLENIFCAAFHSAADIKGHGNEGSFNVLVDQLSSLATDGLTLNINGEDIKVYFVVGAFLGDNLGQNDVTGFVRSFTANYCCRYCRIHQTNMHNQYTEIEELVRNKTNYYEDVLKQNASATGVREDSIFNALPHFHVVESVGCDLTHDLSEGVLHYNLSEIVLYWIRVERYFTIFELNNRIQSFPYDESENGNKPPLISMKKLKRKKFTMTASEMSCFSRHLGFIVGDLIQNPEDPGWIFYKKTIKFVDLCYLPSYDDDDLEDLANACESMNKDYVEVFGQHMKFKHVGTHYSRLTRQFGPLRYIKVIRFEAKHKTLKNYSKNSNNRKNLSYSLARKVQYNSALRFLKAEGLQDQITTFKTKNVWVGNQDYFPKLPQSIYQVLLSERECFSTKKVVVNGLIFSTMLWLPDFFNSFNPQVNQIIDILLLSLNNVNDIFVICKTYDTMYNEHYGCYSVELESFQNKFCIIKISDFLMDHQCPIKLHKVDNKLLFKCKRF